MNLKPVKTNIINKIDTEAEENAKKRKANNICIFNVPESNNESQEKRFQEDVEKVKEILNKHVELKREDVISFYRIGYAKHLPKPRPIVLKLSNYELKLTMLKLRNLKWKDKNIYINPDRTKKEQEEHKKLVLELHARRTEGEENIIIKNGKIITRIPFRPDPQMFWG